MNLFIDIVYPTKQEPTTSSSLEYKDKEMELDEENTKNRREKERVAKPKGRNSKYTWNLVQERRYINFLMTNYHVFELPAYEQTLVGINTQISKAIKSRDPTQCRCHHQKMVKKFKDVASIVSQHQHLLSPKNLRKWNQLSFSRQSDKICAEKSIFPNSRKRKRRRKKGRKGKRSKSQAEQSAQYKPYYQEENQ